MMGSAAQHHCRFHRKRGRTPLHPHVIPVCCTGCLTTGDLPVADPRPRQPAPQVLRTLRRAAIPRPPSPPTRFQTP